MCGSGGLAANQHSTCTRATPNPKTVGLPEPVVHPTHIQKVECLVNDHKTVECLKYDTKANGYVDDNNTAACLVNDHPIAQCLGNAYMVNENTGSSLVKDYSYATRWVVTNPFWFL